MMGLIWRRAVVILLLAVFIDGQVLASTRGSPRP
jgi:hypothetical protein